MTDTDPDRRIEGEEKEEEPDHVRVAEVLGTLRKEHEWSKDGSDLRCKHCGSYSEAVVCAPRYDLRWKWTGPLIEKYGIVLRPTWDQKGWEAEYLVAGDHAAHESDRYADGATPLLAVCNLILEMKAAGKLAS